MKWKGILAVIRWVLIGEYNLPLYWGGELLQAQYERLKDDGKEEV